MGLVARVGRRLSERRLARGKVRTLWGVTPILTLPLKAQADRELGFASQSLVFTTYYISQRFDINLKLHLRVAERFGRLSIHAFERVVLAVVMLRYDIVHYFYDRGILRTDGRSGISPDELDLLRASGARVYGFAYGADVRTRERTLALGRWNFCTDCPEPTKFCICVEADGRRSMTAMLARLTAPVALGDMLTYVPGARNLHYWPIDTERIPTAPPPAIVGPLRIAHAPNHSHFKGTEYLEAAIERLRGRGHAIEYVMVQGVPNTEVLRIFASVDLVADQFIGGAYGYSALEAMALGRPVLTYVRTPDLVEAANECPLINGTPDLIEEVLLWAIDNRPLLQVIGAQGSRYVRAWHCVSAVAERLGRIYEDTASLPEKSLAGILTQRHREQQRRRDPALADPGDWHHPYRVTPAARHPETF